jgi:hypothetical protein
VIAVAVCSRRRDQVSIYGKYQSVTYEEYKIRYPDLPKDEIEKCYSLQTKESVKRAYPNLFVNPKYGIIDDKYIGQELGVKFKKSYEYIKKIFETSSSYTKKEKLNFLNTYKEVYLKILKLKSNPDTKIVLYGTGAISSTIFELLNDQIVAYVDSRSQLMSIDQPIKKSSIYSLRNLKNMEYDFIILSAIGHEETFINQLKKYNIDMTKVISLL